MSRSDTVESLWATRASSRFVVTPIASPLAAPDRKSEGGIVRGREILRRRTVVEEDPATMPRLATWRQQAEHEVGMTCRGSDTILGVALVELCEALDLIDG